MSAWTDEEVMKLIQVWGKDAIQAQLEGCKHNKEVYTKVSKERRKQAMIEVLSNVGIKLKSCGMNIERSKIRTSKQEIIVVHGNTRKQWTKSYVADQLPNHHL